MIDLKKLKKEELIEKYEELQSEYEALQEQYDDLDNCYGELEMQHEELENTPDPWDAIDGFIEKLLKEIVYNTEIQEKVYQICMKYFLRVCDFYCIDIPKEVYTKKIERDVIEGMNKEVEDFIDNFMMFYKI